MPTVDVGRTGSALVTPGLDASPEVIGRRGALLGGLSSLLVAACSAPSTPRAPELTLPTGGVAKPYDTGNFRVRPLPVGYGFFDTNDVVELVDEGMATRDGIVMRLQDGQFYEQPVTQAQYILYRLNAYRHNRDPRFKSAAIRHADHLMTYPDMIRGAAYMPYDYPWTALGVRFAKPWYSGLAQGQVLAALMAVHALTKDEKYLSFCRLLMASFEHRFDPAREEAPWVVQVDGSRSLWFMEYPSKDGGGPHVFNGHMFALAGIHAFWSVTRDPKALDLIQAGLLTMRRSVGLIRIEGNAAAYTTESADPSPAYHPVHVRQVYELYNMTGDNYFAALADAMTSDYPAYRGGGRMTIRPGAHKLVRIDGHSEKIEAERTQSIRKQLGVECAARLKPAGQDSTWLLVKEGRYAGWAVSESPTTAYLDTPIESVSYLVPRQVLLSRGRHQGFSLGDDGVRPASQVESSASTEYTADRSTSMRGQRYHRLASGPLAGSWVLDSPAVRLDSRPYLQ